MKDTKDAAALYLKEDYAENRSHMEDAPWKFNKMIPLIDTFCHRINKKRIKLLDVGGGRGLILNATATYIKEKYGIEIEKFALDLSPGCLKAQKKENPDLKGALNEDIRKTSLVDKNIDLTLMIDVLEHVPNPTDALEEIKRISKFVIFKVPLENNLLQNIWNLVRGGEPRQQAAKTIGHINTYNFRRLISDIEKHTGRVLISHFTNVFAYYYNSKYYQNKMKKRNKWMNNIAMRLSGLSPQLCAYNFGDFAMILTECD